MLLSLGIVSLYSTFAYNEEATKLDDSTADYNLIYSMREASKNQIITSPGETKYVDIDLTNGYQSNVKYGIYYHLISPNKMPENITITLAEDSEAPLEDIIKPNQEKKVTIKIVNNSEDNLDIVVGALVGFENGNIQELIREGEYLIK
jgi:hypothetical protein